MKGIQLAKYALTKDSTRTYNFGKFNNRTVKKEKHSSAIYRQLNLEDVCPTVHVVKETMISLLQKHYNYNRHLFVISWVL